MVLLRNNFIEFSGQNSMVQKRVLDMLREEDAVIGHLLDSHVTWLMKFTYMWFQTRAVAMAFDFHSTPKRIFITPRPRENAVYPLLVWIKHKAAMLRNRSERDLPGYIGLQGFEVKFCRRPHVGMDVGEMKDDDGSNNVSSSGSDADN